MGGHRPALPQAFMLEAEKIASLAEYAHEAGEGEVAHRMSDKIILIAVEILTLKRKPNNSASDYFERT